MIKQILEKTGVFASFLLITVSSVFIYSPTNGSNAASTAADVAVNIGSSLAFSLSTDNVEMEGRPGQTVVSDPIRIYAFTNNAGGMRVTVSDADDDVYMRHTEVDSYIREAYAGLMDELQASGLSEEEFTISKFAVDGVFDVSNLFRVDTLGDNEWGVINNIHTFAYNNGYQYVFPMAKNSDGSGMTLIWSKKANSQYTPGDHTDIRLHTDGEQQYGDVVVINDGYGYSEFVRIDDDLNAYEDVKFAVKIGNVTSGTYTDTVLFTVYPD